MDLYTCDERGACYSTADLDLLDRIKAGKAKTVEAKASLKLRYDKDTKMFYCDEKGCAYTGPDLDMLDKIKEGKLTVIDKP